MQLTSKAKIFALLISGVALLSACQSKVPLNDPAPVTETPVVKTATPPADNNAVKPVVAKVDPLTQGLLAQRSVYFDFDSYVVKDEFKALLSEHAKFLNSNKNRSILVQGNTDERGGNEYNLALGQKRAEAVRKALTLQGVADSQIEAVSLGEEKPKATGHDETSWAENRRADILYK